MKMLIFTRFLNGFVATSGRNKFTRFISYSGAPCAELQADQPEYCESLHIWGVSAGGHERHRGGVVPALTPLYREGARVVASCLPAEFSSCLQLLPAASELLPAASLAAA